MHPVVEQSPASSAEVLEVPVSTIRRGTIHTFEVRGKQVIAFWAGDRLVVASEVCPHIGGPLSDATLEDDGCALRCPWHGYKFDTRTGEFLENPNERFVQQRLKTGYKTYKPGAATYRLGLVPHTVENGMLRV